MNKLEIYIQIESEKERLSLVDRLKDSALTSYNIFPEVIERSVSLIFSDGYNIASNPSEEFKNRAINCNEITNSIEEAVILFAELCQMINNPPRGIWYKYESQVGINTCIKYFKNPKSIEKSSGVNPKHLTVITDPKTIAEQVKIGKIKLLNTNSWRNY